jgi:hypothetical protein
LNPTKYPFSKPILGGGKRVFFFMRKSCYDTRYNSIDKFTAVKDYADARSSP